MRRTMLAALMIAVLVPSTGRAVPRLREPRLDPHHTSPAPSYVQRVERAIVGLKVRAAPGAPSSARLGAHRFVSGVIYDSRGYALTVSYGLLDAVRVEASTRDNRVVPGQVVGLDLDSGLGIVKLDGPGPWPAATLGDSREVALGDLTGTVGVDEDNDLVYVAGHVHAIRKFSAAWEYMLERAFLIAPSSPSWGGSAVVDAKGQVIGMASLRLGDEPYVNLAIPLERFVPVKEELVSAGRVMSRRPRPWLGLYTTTHQGRVVVEGFAAKGPALTAGFQKGDRIVRVNSVEVASQEEFYEQLWRGRAGDEIVVAVHRADRVHEIRVRSVDRQAFITTPRP